MVAPSLTILGSGVKSISHITVETSAYLSDSECVFYLVNEPILEQLVQQQNQNAISLDFLYDCHANRISNYRAIGQHVAQHLDNQKVCLLLYGHPTVFCDIAIEADKAAQALGHSTLILPGISAEDCLFADLKIDPSSCGCLSYEATDLLVYKRQLNVSSHLVLWQVGMIGALGNFETHDNQRGQALLCEYLLSSYDADHAIICYEASQYPHFQPVIKHFSLSQLPEEQLSPISTLYIAPCEKAKACGDTLNALGIKALPA